MSIKLIFVRHGEIDQNVTRVTAGHGPYPLNEKGKEQARRVAEWLKTQKIDAIYVSDSVRTKQTAEHIIKHHPNAKVVYTPQLREKNLGVLEGKPYGITTIEAEKKGIPILEYRPEGGESFLDVRKRAIEFVENIIKTEQGKTVLLVSHGGPITQMLMYIMKFPDTPEEYGKHHPKNTAITIIELEEDMKHKVHLLNSVEHLV